MFRTDSKRKEEEVVEDDQDGNNGHASVLSTAMDADNRMKSLHRHIRKTSSSTVSSSRGSVSVRSSRLGFGLRRAFLIGRRGGPSTPMPSWKVFDNSIFNASLKHHHHHLQHGHPGQGLHISARKLAATIWELQELPFSRAVLTGNLENMQKEPQHMSNSASSTEHRSMPHGQPLSPASSRISKGSHKRQSIQIKFGDGGKAHVRLEKRNGKLVMPVTNASKKEKSSPRSGGCLRGGISAAKGCPSSVVVCIARAPKRGQARAGCPNRWKRRHWSRWPVTIMR